jgi:phosphoribosyl 1,2-cyclic phosphodiesterase
MSLTYCLLASGSKGNATYVCCGEAAVLVDCGLSGAELLRRLEAARLEAGRIRAVVLTHEHRDHAAGVGVVARRLKVPVVATPATWHAAEGLRGCRHHPMQPGRSFTLGPLTITPFPTSHDAADPVGLVFSQGSARLGLCTDLGVATRLVQVRLQGCQALVIEHNHDPHLLATGPYQPWLKQRVRSSQGHLSNQQGSELLARLHHRELQQVVLAHLSEVNNRPKLARRQAAATLAALDSRAHLEVARQDRPTPVMEI